MNKKKFVIVFIILIICILISLLIIGGQKEDKMENNDNNKGEEVNMIKLSVNGKILDIKLENNSSSVAFMEKLKNGEIIVKAEDYGNFEKVGDLGFDLPTNDKQITTEPGDLILYQGNKITLYYDTNTWTFTKLGKVQNVSKENLKQILGSDDVTLKFSLENTDV